MSQIQRTDSEIRASNVRDYVSQQQANRGTALGNSLSNTALFGSQFNIFRGNNNGRNTNDVYDARNGIGFNNGFLAGFDRSYGNSGRVATESTNKRFALDAQKWALGMDVAQFVGSMIQGFYGMFSQPDVIMINSAWGDAASNSKGSRIVSK